MLNAPEVAPVSEGVLVAASVYPLPVLLIERSLNVATPPEAATVVVPLSVPPPALVPIASVTLRVSAVTTIVKTSSTRTAMAGALPAPAPAVVGCWGRGGGWGAGGGRGAG